MENNRNYHEARAEHCRAMASMSADADVRRRHEELAALHASRAAASHVSSASAELSAA